VADGRVSVTDTNNQRVQVFTMTGGFLGKWGQPGNGDGQFQFPNGIVVAPDRKVYVADPGLNRIQVFCVTPPPLR
jgi:DNA-binding beta-propeller fold protein YncE